MEIPKGFKYRHSRKTHCLRLKKNLYGQRQASKVWVDFLHQGLIKIGFKQSKIDECVYYRGNTIFLCYVDDTILISPDDSDIDKTIAQLRDLKYDLSDEGEIDDFLGVKVEYQEDGAIKLSQPQLIDQILNDLRLLNPPVKNGPTKTAETPAARRTGR